MWWNNRDKYNKADHPVEDRTRKNESESAKLTAKSYQTKMAEKDDIQSDLSIDKVEKGRRPDETKRKTFKLSQGFFTKIMILSLAIGRCVSAKSIDGLTLKN